jgi:hypothetical protein
VCAGRQRLDAKHDHAVKPPAASAAVSGTVMAMPTCLAVP